MYRIREKEREREGASDKSFKLTKERWDGQLYLYASNCIHLDEKENSKIKENPSNLWQIDSISKNNRYSIEEMK